MCSLHNMCRLEGKYLRNIFAMSAQTSQLFGCLLIGEGGNFIDVVGSTA